MGRIKKKGTSGAAKNYITRTQAVRKLQISLPDFRRLCIFKGIYPREPRNKKKVSKGATPATTFYYARDIQYLLHEPVLNKFRDHKALAKKIGRALGRGEVGDAARLERTQTPKITLDHIIKERYPTFIDALRDLDDALSMLFLFANLPSTSTVPPKMIALCERLTLEFEHYLITSRSLRKSFLSIKGIYYQATIQGQDIMWVVPYKFVQRVTGDVDFRIMGTFVEFYTTLLGFVNFRLYTSAGLVYPPKFDANSDEKGAELGAFTLEGKDLGSKPKALEIGANGEASSEEAAAASATAQAEADKLAQQVSTESKDADAVAPTDGEAPTDAIDTFEATGEDADILAQPQFRSNDAVNIFEPYTFFLGRETPRHPLEFLLKAFGCKRVGWDVVLGDGAFTSDERDSRITHQIVDRPNLPPDALPAPEVTNGEDEQNGADAPSTKLKPGSRVPGRTYVQPQWVWDCINQGKLLRPDLYAPGATLPPHLSPWQKPKKGEYDPTAPLAEQEREGEAEEAEIMEDDEEDELDVIEPSVKGHDLTVLADSGDVQPGEGMGIAGSSSEDDEDEDEEDATAGAEADDDEWGGFSDNEEDPADVSDSELSRRQHQVELAAEAAGGPVTVAESLLRAAAEAGDTGKALKVKKAAMARKEKVEELERQAMMLSRRKRKLFGKMQYSNAKKDAESEKLRAKRRKIEKGRREAVA